MPDELTGEEPTTYDLAELAAASGVSERTIRYYQTERLLPRPGKRGRDAVYSVVHLERLTLIGELRDRGLTLQTIGELLSSEHPTATVSEWLGVDATLTAPWSDDRPRTVTNHELVAQIRRYGTDRPGTIGELQAADRKGTISFAAARYKVGVWLAGQDVNVVCDGGLVQIHHRGVLISTHARRHEPAKQQAGMQRQTRRREAQPRPTASVVTVSRKVDSSGNVSFAGANYRVGNAHRRRQVQVAVVGDFVEIAIGEQLIRRHKVKHDRTREHGALANPGGRPRRINAA